MAGHGPRLDALYTNLVEGKSTPPAGNGNSGSLNFIVMDRFTAWLADPTRENKLRCLETLAEFKREGHLTLRKRDKAPGQPTFATEQGAPGMHGEYVFAAVAGAMLRASPSSERPSPELFAACREYVLDELALDVAFRFARADGGDDGVYIPAPRVKEAGPGSKKGQTSDDTGKQMRPHDGYRDVRLALALGEPVNKKDAFWLDPQSIGVWCMRELLVTRLQTGLNADNIRRHPVPKLFMPIFKIALPNGGFLAYLEKTPLAENNTIDVCDWVLVQPGAQKIGKHRALVKPGFKWLSRDLIALHSDLPQEVFGR